MAFVDWSQIEETDYSTPYKTFLDLQDGDKIYEINLSELIVIEHNIYHFHSELKESYKVKNKYEVEFNFNQDSRINPIRIYDGNTYISEAYVDYKKGYYTTDKRIADIIISILRDRNKVQWKQFSSIFGNPLSGKYEPKHIVLN